MPKIPLVRGKDLVKVLETIGFIQFFGKGSHLVMKHKDGRRTIIPLHGKEIPKGTLLAILRDIEVSKEDLVKLLKK